MECPDISINPSTRRAPTATSVAASGQQPSPYDQITTADADTLEVAHILRYGGMKRKADSEVEETNGIKHADKKVKQAHTPARYTQDVGAIPRFVSPALAPDKRKATYDTDNVEYMDKHPKQAHASACPAQEVEVLPCILGHIIPKKRKVDIEYINLDEFVPAEKRVERDTSLGPSHFRTPNKNTYNSAALSTELNDIQVAAVHTGKPKSDDVFELSAAFKPTPVEFKQPDLSACVPESAPCTNGICIHEEETPYNASQDLIDCISIPAPVLCASTSVPKTTSVTAARSLKTTTSSSQQPLVIQYAVECGHPLHPTSVPADWKSCPPCTIKLATKESAHRTGRCEDHITHYTRAVTDQEEHIIIKVDINGLGKKKDWKGHITNWRSFRVQLLRTVALMESNVESETKWDAEHPEVLADEQPWTDHTCAKGWEEWIAFQEDEEFTKLQCLSQQHANEVASNLEAHLDDPDEGWPSEVKAPWRCLSIKSEFKVMVAREATIDFRNQRERRTEVHETGVRWEEKVLARKADVEVLRKLPSFTESNPHKKPSQLRSILRTTAHPGTPSATERRPEASRYEVRELSGSWNRPYRSKFRPARSLANGFARTFGPDGTERVNTSLCASWPEDVAYVEREAYLAWLWGEEEE